jgi:putative tryptophan/tyrosine transport system substrate-binding protein
VARNVRFEQRWAGSNDQLPAFASDLVEQKVTAIVAGGMPAVLAAKHATTTIPIIFGVGADPVAFGLVASLSRPGSNVTGATNLNLELEDKRLEPVHEMPPGAKRIALLVNPSTVLAGPMAKDMQATAGEMGLDYQIVRASTEKDIDDAFASLAQMHIDALMIGADTFFGSRSEKLADLAARNKIPTIGSYPRFVRDGGLMSYGGDTLDVWRLMGIYAGRILSGEKPADLPVQQSTKVELFVNLKAAKALGIEVPVDLLGRADQVIE